MSSEETATPKIKMSQKTPSDDDPAPQEVGNVKDTSATTPMSSSSSSWWGGFISQAKEKVNQNLIQLINMFLFAYQITSQLRFFKQ